MGPLPIGTYVGSFVQAAFICQQGVRGLFLSLGFASLRLVFIRFYISKN